MNTLERLRLFWKGWQRQSMVMLDAAGCPLWLQKRRCPTLTGWGTLLSELSDAITYPNQVRNGGATDEL